LGFGFTRVKGFHRGAFFGLRLAFSAAHITKQMRALVRADGDEIMAGLGIIVAFQADGICGYCIE
jgi:hypothetical protein